MQDSTITIRGYLGHEVIHPDPQNPGRDAIIVRTSAPGSANDGYHSFDEMYQHRYLLFLMLVQIGQYPAYKGAVEDGYFVGGILIDDQQVAYHLPESLWRAFPATIEQPEWDGHTPNHALCRIWEHCKPK